MVHFDETGGFPPRLLEKSSPISQQLGFASKKNELKKNGKIIVSLP